MEIVLPAESNPNESMTFYNIDYSNRTYHTITLTGDELDDRIKLQYAKLELRRMIKEDDSIHGLHINISNNAKYWAMVELFDVCNIEWVKYYVLDMKTGDFWALHKPIPQHISTNLPEITSFRCGTKMYVPTRDEMLLGQIDMILQDFKLFFQNINLIWPSVILYILMLMTTLWGLIRK